MAKHRKATMSSRLDRRRSARSRCRSRGAGASLRCAAARPKNGQAEEPYRRRGPPAGRTNRSQPTRHIPGIHAGPSLALPCGHTDGSSAATSTSGRGAGNGVFLPFPARQECRSSSSLHPGACDAARERQRAVTSSMPWCGSTSSREARRRAFRSIRGNARRDRPGFQIGTVFLESRIASPGGNLLLTRNDQGNNGPT